MSRPLDGLCGIEREAIINERGERLVSIYSRRCEIARGMHDRCVVLQHESGEVGAVLEQAVTKCESKYNRACPKICRRSERLTCTELTEQLTTMKINYIKQEQLAEESEDIVSQQSVDFKTLSFISSRKDYRLPLGPYIKAVDYYGNPVTIDTTTSCTVIRRQVDPEVLERLRLDYIADIRLEDELAHNLTISELSPSSSPPEFVPTIILEDPKYSAPRLKLTNVQQKAKRGVIDFAALDYSDFPVVSPGTSLSIRGEIGFSYNLSFTCENALPVILEPIFVHMQIGQCEAGKALNQAEECQRCRAGRYSPDGTTCLDCPLGAICEMPCPIDEPCEGSVGTDWPLAEKGYWENMGPRDLIDGGESTNASIAWWDEQHFKQGVRTDSDDTESDLKMTRRRRRLNAGTYHSVSRNLNSDNAMNSMSDSALHDELMVDSANYDSAKYIKATESERKFFRAQLKDNKERQLRLEITNVLRKRFSVQEAITKNAFRAADLDGSGFIEGKRSRRTICEAYPKNVRRMLKLPVYMNEEDGSQVWCRKKCPKTAEELAKEAEAAAAAEAAELLGEGELGEGELATEDAALSGTTPSAGGQGNEEDRICDCDVCRNWERNEYTELASKFLYSIYFIPDPMFNTRRTYTSDGVVDTSEIDIVYHTMATSGALTATKTIRVGGLGIGDPTNICVDTREMEDTYKAIGAYCPTCPDATESGYINDYEAVKCTSNKQCTNKGLFGGCMPHPSEAAANAMDLDRDGRLSYEELVEAVNVNMKESFDIIDTDQDELISLIELNTFISTMWNEIIDPLNKYTTDKEIEVNAVIFNTMDWNNDEYMDIAEYVFLYSNTDVVGATKTKSRTISPLELFTSCRQSTDLLWNEPIGRPIFQELCGGASYEYTEEIPKPKKMNMDWIENKNKSMQPYGWNFGEVWPTGVNPHDATMGLPIPDPSVIPENATIKEIALLPLSIVKRRVVRLNNDDNAFTLNFHELKNALLPPGHLDPSLSGPVRDPVSNQSAYCYWRQEHCLSGEKLDDRLGECRLVTDATETQMFECTTGMRFYRCPLGDISCPGSSKICYETNKPPLVCAPETTLAACLKCRAAESAQIAEEQKAIQAKLSSEANEASLTEDITAPGEDEDNNVSPSAAEGARRSLGMTSGNSSGAINATDGGNLGASETQNPYVYSETGNSNAMCRWGYEGPMCNKCIVSYWKTPANTCERCKTSSEDSQRGDRNLQMYIYVGGGSFGMFIVLLSLGIYLRQDGGYCPCCKKCCCCKMWNKRKQSQQQKVTPISATHAHSGTLIQDKLAKRWFRPEKFKIMLSFLQIFSQMNSNYGVNWPTITADYMRLLSAVNIDIVKLAALDCLFRSNFYFSLTMMCLMPFGGLSVLMFYMWVGRSLYKRELNQNHRKCIMTGKEVVQPMTAKFYLATRLRVAATQLGNQEFA